MHIDTEAYESLRFFISEKYSAQCRELFLSLFKRLIKDYKSIENMSERFVSKKAMPNKHKKCTCRTSFLCACLMDTLIIFHEIPFLPFLSLPLTHFILD